MFCGMRKLIASRCHKLTYSLHTTLKCSSSQSFQSKTSLNNVHLFTIQVTGCCLVHSAVSTARQQKSLESDALVYSSWLLSRLIVCT